MTAPVNLLSQAFTATVNNLSVLGHYAVLCGFLVIPYVSTLLPGSSSGNMMMIKCDLAEETYCVYVSLYFFSFLFFCYTMLFYFYLILFFMVVCNCRSLNVIVGR